MSPRDQAELLEGLLQFLEPNRGTLQALEITDLLV